MATLLIGYDLNSPGKDYSSLIGAIKAYSSWWHHLDSTWLVVCEDKPVAVRNALQKLIDANDELLVIDVTGRERAWAGFNESGSKWLNETYQ